MQTLHHTTLRLLGAVVKYESNPNYTRKSGNFTNGGAETVTLQPGTLLTGGATPAVYDQAAPAAFSGICLTRIAVQPSETVAIAWLANGEAIVNASEVDWPTDGAQRTTLETAITDAGIKLVDGLDT